MMQTCIMIGFDDETPNKDLPSHTWTDTADPCIWSGYGVFRLSCCCYHSTLFFPNVCVSTALEPSVFAVTGKKEKVGSDGKLQQSFHEIRFDPAMHEIFRRERGMRECLSEQPSSDV